jgi:hypothetical protein
MSHSTAQCPMCPKIVAVKFSTERLIVHDTPEGVGCAGSELRLPAQAAAPAAEWKPTPRRKRNPPPAADLPAAPPIATTSGRRKPESKGGSVWAVSGGLPSLGKRR